MEQVYNKLVRDKIPEKIEQNGEKPIYCVLNDQEYKIALEKKLFEEYNEVINSTGNDRIEELADLLEVIELDDVIKTMEIKKEKRGGFNNKILLKKVITK